MYGDFGNALLNVYLVLFSIGDPHVAISTEYSHVSACVAVWPGVRGVKREMGGWVAAWR